MREWMEYKSHHQIICYILGGMLCILGIIRIISYFKSPVSMSYYSLGLVIGLIAIGFGGYIFAKPEALINVLATVFGIIIIIDAVIKLQNAIDMLRLGEERWWIMLIVTVVTAVLGAIMLLKADVVLQFVGVALIITGIMDIIDIIALSNRINKAEAPDDVIETLRMNRDKGID